MDHPNPVGVAVHWERQLCVCGHPRRFHPWSPPGGFCWGTHDLAVECGCDGFVAAEVAS